MESAFHQDGPANEAIGSAHEPHDGDLPAADENGQTNRVVDDEMVEAGVASPGLSARPVIEGAGAEDGR